MDQNQRFAILTFPQFFDGNVLGVNVVFLPRNQNPLTHAIIGAPPIPDAPVPTPAFADARLSFVARIVGGAGGMPEAVAPTASVPLATAAPANARALFAALAEQFQISNKGALNTNASVNAVGQVAPAPRTLETSVKKYLPHTYRNSFNFVAPRTPNAVTDDSYHCALRDATPNPAFLRSPEALNWGQVFAAAMRQPQLASALGMIYRAEIAVDATFFRMGGWLYVDLADGSDYQPQQAVDPTFVKRYAARIPVLEVGTPRSVFGAIQFPVATPAPPGNYDELFIEAADYDDGFAKVVHAFQPVSSNLLQEQSDGLHPTKEVGIRLGWDDEQILIWYIRQLAEDLSAGAGKRIDAPIGTFGYKIDIREDLTAPGPWTCLNAVRSKAPLIVVNPATQQVIALGDFAGELPYQVYPAQLDGHGDKPFWLPMYFADWAGKSMVLPDEEAAALYKQDDTRPRPDIHVGGPPADRLNAIYAPGAIVTRLRYGRAYQFRIRLADLSGGGPELARVPHDETLSQVARCRFKRFTAPDIVRIDGLPANTDDILFNQPALALKRPLLGYPSVVFTGKYADPVALLQDASDAMAGKEAFGIADPDVDSVEITVELQTLKMDNIQSVSGRESYVHFYTVTRSFPRASAVFEDELLVPLEYRDCKVLNFGDPGDLGDLGFNQAQLDALPALVLPRARTIRLTIRAACEARPDYYGLEKPDHAFNTRYGRTIQFQLRADPLADELGLLSPARRALGIYLQPDPPALFDGDMASLLLGKEVARMPDIVERLAQQLGVVASGLTLVARRGERVQFGCSQRIRHTLAPDNSSITFASKGDLARHWLGCILMRLERDWTWDGLDDRSVVFERTKHFKEDHAATEIETLEVGDIEIRKTAPFHALLEPDRSHTILIFIDAIETHSERLQPAPHSGTPRFPDLIEVEYTVKPAYKRVQAAATDGDYGFSLTLPITTPPVQMPKIVSAGLALSPYVARNNYAETEPRRRFLWVEFAEPIRDPRDMYFARVLAYAPDQLLCDNRPELLVAPEEPSLAIDAEYIRVITYNQPNDEAGLDALQPMEPATGPGKDADRFYLLPIPPNLHPEAPELFGIFTYEFRVGHYRYTDTAAGHAQGDLVWTTAQGRYGRRLRVPGIQHPAPTLTCTVDRDAEKLYVTAPYAVAVSKGKNVTSDPPRTEICALLYAQVLQADGTQYRNILLDDRMLSTELRVEHKKDLIWRKLYTAEQRSTLARAALRNFKGDLRHAGFTDVFKLADRSAVSPDATKFGTAIWVDPEVDQLLAQYGLPPDAPLSVLCVELFPHITNIYEHVSALQKGEQRENLGTMLGAQHVPSAAALAHGLAERSTAHRSITLDEDRPLSNQLGHYRILRTSPLTKVPFVC